LTKTTIALLTFVFLLASGGCGYKSNPVPSYQLLPTPIIDLGYQLDDKGATLQWSYPSTTVNNDAVTDSVSFDLYRADVPVDSYCKTCPIPFVEPISLPGGTLPPGGSKVATYQATMLQPGHLYFFKVRSKIGWWIESKDSNIVSFLWQTPPMAPEGLTVISGDSKITLKWHPVSRHQDGTPMTAPVRYKLYRSVGDGAFAQIGEPVSTTSSTDSGVENGKTYSYQIQAINTYNQSTVPGPRSASVTAAPVDRTAPPVPQGVQGIRTDVGVKIYWEHVDGGDLAGYRVYRRAEGQNRPTYVGDVKLPYNMFIDTKVPQKGQLFYMVSSIDMQDPANESAKSSEVKISD
jgi:hypothetical protein